MTETDQNQQSDQPQLPVVTALTIGTPRGLFSILWPVEWLVLLMAGVIFGVYHGKGLTMPGQPGAQSGHGPGLFYLKQLLTSLDLYAIVLCITLACGLLQAIRHFNWVLKDVPWRKVFEGLTRRLWLDEIFRDIRLFNAALVMFVEFSLLKNLIPHINSHIWDSELIDLEQKWFGGKLLAEYLHQFLGTGIADYISQCYIWYFPYMTICLFIMIAQSNRYLAKEFFLAFVLIFFVGVFWVFLFPTWGPVYVLPGLFEFVRETPVGAIQWDLWSMKLELDKHPGSTQAIFMISGFPSLHVAVALLGTFYLRYLHRYLALASGAFLLLTLISTIYLGWHYFLDNVGSVALVIFAILIAKQFTPRQVLAVYDPRIEQ